MCPARFALPLHHPLEAVNFTKWQAKLNESWRHIFRFVGLESCAAMYSRVEFNMKFNFI